MGIDISFNPSQVGYKHLPAAAPQTRNGSFNPSQVGYKLSYRYYHLDQPLVSIPHR